MQTLLKQKISKSNFKKIWKYRIIFRKVEEKSNALKEAISKEDYESMKKLLEELQQELYAVGSSVYQQPGNQPPSPGSAGGPDQNESNEKGGDDVIDADFTETKD